MLCGTCDEGAPAAVRDGSSYGGWRDHRGSMGVAGLLVRQFLVMHSARADDVLLGRRPSRFNERVSMISLALAQLSAEGPVHENHITKNDRQQNQRAHQHEYLGRGSGRRLPDRQ